MIPYPKTDIELQLSDVFKKFDFVESPASTKTKHLRLVDAISEGLDEAMKKNNSLVIMGQDIESRYHAAKKPAAKKPAAKKPAAKKPAAKKPAAKKPAAKKPAAKKPAAKKPAAKKPAAKKPAAKKPAAKKTSS